MSNTPTHGSDVQETPDWWKASDGRFYPPELHPDYKKPAPPAAPTAPAASAAVADAGPAVTSAASDAASGVAGMAGGAAAGAAGAVTGAAGAARSTVESGADGVADAAAAAKSVVPDNVAPVVDPRATMPAAAPGLPDIPSTPAVTPVQETVIQSAASMAPGDVRNVPPLPAAGAPSAPNVEQGPAGITYTAPTAPFPAPAPAQAPIQTTPATPSYAAPGGPGLGTPDYAQPAATATSKVSSTTAALMAIVAGLAAIGGSLMQWGKGAVTSANGIERATIEVAGFDSSGPITAICGGVLLICGVLFLMGVPKQIYWAVAAFLAGGTAVGAVVFSLIDIRDLSNRYALDWRENGLAAIGDVISTQADLGLWVAGAGGVLGVLAAPFVNRAG